MDNNISIYVTIKLCLLLLWQQSSQANSEVVKPLISLILRVSKVNTVYLSQQDNHCLTAEISSYFVFNIHPVTDC